VRHRGSPHASTVNASTYLPETTLLWPNSKLEYIWLDGYTPLASLRSKTKIIDGDPAKLKLEDLPVWGFDGSSTQQAEGKNSDLPAKTRALYPDVTRKNGFLIMSEVLLPNGEAHPSNSRATILDDPDTWFGFEQEYFFWKDGAPLGFPSGGFSGSPGSVLYWRGLQERRRRRPQLVEEHIDTCVAAGINIEGINAEVAKGQWEFQIFGKGSKTAADQMWTARYIIARLCEPYGIDIEWRASPSSGHSIHPSIGMAPACTAIFPQSICARRGGKNISRNSWPLSTRP